MRTTLRNLIDGDMAMAAVNTAQPIAPPQKSPTLRQPAQDPKVGTGKLTETSKQQGTALAKHVGEHMQDPIGSTKEGFDKLAQKKLEYDMAKEEMQRNLAPVQSVIDHVSQMHDLNENGIPDELEPGMGGQDQAQGYHGPNAGDRRGMPQNMAQQPGRQQMSRPGQQVSYPGAGPKIPGAPAQQAKPEAPASKAAPKGQMKTGKMAQRGINVSVKASDGIASAVSNRIRSTFANAQLANMSCCETTEPLVKKVAAGGPGSGCQGANCGRKSSGDAKNIVRKALERHSSGLDDQAAEKFHNSSVYDIATDKKHPLSGTLSRQMSSLDDKEAEDFANSKIHEIMYSKR